MNDSNQPMDSIDIKQQQEITDLQKKDIKHDAQFDWLTKIYFSLFVIVLALFVGGVILAPIMFTKEKQADSLQFWCPHEECPHHQTLKGYSR